MLRFLFPYLLLLIIVGGYIFYRHQKLGSVLLRVKRRLFTRYSLDSFFLIIVIMATSYFLARYEVDHALPGGEELFFGDYTFAIFYLFLILVVIAREAEKPTLRERGISSSRGFWLWPEIDSYRFIKEALQLTFSKGRRQRVEVWPIDEAVKKEIEPILRQHVEKQSGKCKKKR